MFESVPITASKVVDGETVRAEFLCDTGRLRIVSGTQVRAEWFPPHSWFAIASISGHSRWGTRPDEADLLRLIDNYAGYSSHESYTFVNS
ncbi:hypothetical protein [Paraburkholderia sp. DHOC27]|uniref:hypothetical protein n=1 Tax=Paraburkholderia sp. DHOC27 TaxID=2303330 RepID=UPI000E3B9221|nr:hypothetical protein [Paraburkholderia sp. DHOC27]RFU44591.1 hypothetical protein D0B32_26160 [Paraburkholderia sp. DHOC27]